MLLPLSYNSLMSTSSLLLTVCSCHVTYVFQSESTLYSCLNVKELLARNRREIWRWSGCNWTRTQNNLVLKRTLNHLANWSSVRLRTKWLWVRVQLQSSLLLFQIIRLICSCYFFSCCSELIASNSNPSLLTFCFSYPDLLHRQVSFLLLPYTYYPYLYQQQLLPEVLPTCDNLMVDSLHLHEETSCLLNVANSPRLYYLLLLPVHQNGFK